MMLDPPHEGYPIESLIVEYRERRFYGATGPGVSRLGKRMGRKAACEMSGCIPAVTINADFAPGADDPVGCTDRGVRRNAWRLGAKGFLNLKAAAASWEKSGRGEASRCGRIGKAVVS